jgi:hypothetical protein
MRGTFVIRLAPETLLARDRLEGGAELEGWAEEVDSGKELRFRSAEELLQFLTQCIHAVRRCESDS